MFEDRRSGFFRNIKFLISDLISIELAFVLAFIIRNFQSGVDFKKAYLILYLAILLFTTIFTFISESYKDILLRNNSNELRDSFKTQGAVFATLVVFVFIFKVGNIYSRAIFLMWFFMGTILVFINRTIIKKYLHDKYNVKAIKKLYVVCEDLNDIELTNYLVNWLDEYDLKSVGILDHKSQAQAGKYIQKGLDSIIEYINREIVDEILLYNISDLEKTNSYINTFLSMGIPTHINSIGNIRKLPKAEIVTIGDDRLITFYNNKITESDLFFKRMIDIVGAITGLILTAIVSIVLVPAIYFTDPGPVIFSQKRVGKNGRFFKFYKFRSMYVDAESRLEELLEENEMDGYMFKIKDDPRITPVGKFIRRVSLDEFPQFYNVLKGDMSLVGIRPPTIREFEMYKPHHKSRLAMKPGITGLWQTSGRNDISDFEEVVKLDNIYIDNWNLALDIKIIFRTIVQIFSPKGAS